MFLLTVINGLAIHLGEWPSLESYYEVIGRSDDDVILAFESFAQAEEFEMLMLSIYQFNQIVKSMKGYDLEPSNQDIHEHHLIQDRIDTFMEQCRVG
jgi:hypothetical protein